MTTRALVLSGGGVAGIAWETGLLAGLAEAGTDVSDADLVVGTSAGSVVGSQLACGIPLSELLEQQLAPETEALGQGAQIDIEALMQLGQRFVNVTEITTDILKEIGALALSARTVLDERWIGSFEERLEGRDWPDGRLLVTAVDVETGEFKAWDRTCGVPLATAVASSCAVPAVFPPVTIHGRRYMDGGIRSPAELGPGPRLRTRGPRLTDGLVPRTQRDARPEARPRDRGAARERQPGRGDRPR